MVEQALIDRVAELEALELMLLFRSLPKVHLTGSDLYLDVCDRLAALTDHGDLTAEEIVSIVAAAEPDTPKHILRNMLVNHLRAYVGRVDLSAADALAVLRALAMLDPSSDPREEEQLRDLAGRVVRQLLEGLGTLTASQIGEAAHYLSLLGALEVEFPTRESAELTRALVDAFCAQLHGVDAGAVASMIESVSAADPAFVVRVGDTIRDNHDQFAPDEHATVLEGVVGTANLAVAGRMPAGREAAIDLLKDVLEVHETIVTNTAFDPDARTYLRSVEALAMVDSRLRQRSPQQFNAAARRVLASLAANARSLSASECVRALSAAASLGTAATDAVLDSLLRWLLEAGQCLAPGDVGPILRAAQALPPLPTTRSRTRMTHEVLPKLLDRADGGSGRAADP
uniref:Uncharacterized protein n=1 Tax=Neobodo designis TaxID=312471 RepID=A0A7S1Q4Q9_NEODS